jgi:hypothetical protein
MLRYGKGHYKYRYVSPQRSDSRGPSQSIPKVCGMRTLPEEDLGQFDRYGDGCIIYYEQLAVELVHP